jgi:hypothetical protein
LLDNILQKYILTYKTISQIILDFQTLFPQYASYSDDLLTTYINLNFFLVPQGIIRLGFDATYNMFLYSLAHVLVSQDVQLDGSSSSLDDRLSTTMTADGVSIAYRDLGTAGTMVEWEYFYGNTNYGKMVLMLMKNNGFGASWGAYVI